ncbi:MAG TPA: hypothetical protein VJH67_02120 [Candidatus Paceibacterota bacterium]
MVEVTNIEEHRNRYPKYSQVRQNTEEQEEPEKKQRIKLWMGACLIAAAGSIDLIQALLTLVAIGIVISPIISVGATFLFWLWLTILGVPFGTSPKRLAIMATQAVAELFPAIDALPILTTGTILLVLITRSEDRGGIIGKVASKAQGTLKKAA